MTSSPRHAAPGSRAGRDRWQHVIAVYGWRAYAVPVLLILTLTAALQMSHPATAQHRQAGTGGGVPASGATTARPDAGATSGAVPVLAWHTDSTVCLTNTATSLVLVSLRRQHAWMCQGHLQVNSSPVTTGAAAAGQATPTGSWLLENKQTDRYLTGPGYRDFVHYWIPFDGDFGFHDASWQATPYGSPDYRTAGSHGCVHVPLPVARWLFAWAHTGSTVVTITN